MKDKTKKEKGNSAENYANKFLKRAGYKIIRRNFNCKTGEIDIIARDTQTAEIVFVEVRFREYGIDAAIDSVNHSKQKRIIKASVYFLLINPEFADSFIRYDIIALSKNNKKWVIEHIKDAFRNW